MKFNYNLKKGKKSDSIIMEFRHRATRVRLSTNIYIPSSKRSYWDSKKQQLKYPNDIPESRTINEKLHEYQKLILQKADDLIENRNLNSNNLKKAITEILNKTQIQNDKTELNTLLIDYFESYINKLIKEPSLFSGKRISNGSIRTFKTALKCLKSYDEDLKITFNDLNRNLILDYKIFLEDQGYSMNYIGTIISKLRTVIKASFNDGLIEERLHEDVFFKRTKEDVDHVYLTQDEIDKIIEIKENSSYRNVIEIIIIACYTGMRVGDLFDFLKCEEKNIINENGVYYLNHLQSKTSNNMCIPLHKDVIDNTNISKGIFPKPVHPNILNKKIKEICRIVNINSEVQITKTLGGKKETFKHKKYELITMHSLRRSFCTNAILKGASPHEVMFISGHTKTSTFNKYVKASKFEKAKSILESPMFS